MDHLLLTIDWNMLDKISYCTALGKSLKNTLRKFKRDDLFDELFEMIKWFTFNSVENNSDDIVEKRVKSIHSCKLKYDKYYPNKPVEEAFNDILGLRFVVEDYKVVDNLVFPESIANQIRIVDMRHGKRIDDGYRAIHLYFQKNHYHYPIEIQIVTSFDRQFNEWLHMYVYKYVQDSNIGCELRSLYESGIIKSEDDFRREFRNVLPDSEKV